MRKRLGLSFHARIRARRTKLANLRASPDGHAPHADLSGVRLDECLKAITIAHYIWGLKRYQALALASGGFLDVREHSLRPTQRARQTAPFEACAGVSFSTQRHVLVPYNFPQ